MHKSSFLRMEWFVNEYLNKKKEYKVLDIGSYFNNGDSLSLTYKSLFQEKKYKYTGLDIMEGPNVDIVPQDIYDWTEIKDDQFDVVISGQAFEHIEFFWITISEMARVLKKGGLICIIAPNGFKEHRYPVDCWRFFSDGMVAIARWANLKVLHAHTNCAPTIKDHEWFSLENSDSILIAKKEYSGKPIFNTKNYNCVPLNDRQKHQNFIIPEKYFSKISTKIRTKSKLLKSYVKGYFNLIISKFFS